jgi:ParB family chromosome partitioning protein|tara:strand:- start:607 stop:1455 length:849 start_codon:yes stop_codon:yes gene_type:complete
MNKENKKLGRGLSSLLSSTNNKDENLGEKIFKLINISSIKANPQQPRKKFSKDELEDLSASIKSKGIIQPILVREIDKDLFEIIVGERRWRAAQIAGIHQIPAVIKQMNDEEVMQAALIENIQRENLNPVEEARTYQTILKSDDVNYENLSNAIGKSKSHISNTIRLLELDLKIINYIEEGKISMGHARALIGVPNAVELADEIINKKLSVREVEHNTSKYKKNKLKKTSKDPNIINLEKELSEKIGLKTSIHFKEQGSSGHITLYYSDLNQLDDIMKRLKK